MRRRGQYSEKTKLILKALMDHQNLDTREIAEKYGWNERTVAVVAWRYLARVLDGEHPVDKGEISDGYHTFNELYDHRITLYLALCRALQDRGKAQIWRSSTHSNGSAMDGWFILGIGTQPGRQITYHLPMERWGEADFAPTLDRAPVWDGHTSADVLERLKTL